MHIIAIGWLFVALMLAVGQRSVFMGIVAFLGWGLLPLALFLYLANTRARRRRMQDTPPTE